MKIKNSWWIGIVLLMTILLSGYMVWLDWEKQMNSDYLSKRVSGTQPQIEKTEVVFIAHDLDSSFIAHVTESLIQESKDYEFLKLTILDSRGRNAKQMDLIDQAIQRGVDGLIINPNDQIAILPYIKKAMKAKIPIVIINMNLKESAGIPYIGSDDYQAGAIQGKKLIESLGGKGDVLLLLGKFNQIPTIKRLQGLQDAIKDYPGIKIVEKSYAEWDRYRAAEVVNSWMKTYPNVDAIVAQNDEMILGALSVLEKRGIKMVTIGVDGLPEAIEAVKEERLTATVFQDAQKEAKLSLETILKMIRSDRNISPPSIEFELIDQNNVDLYINETKYK